MAAEGGVALGRGALLWPVGVAPHELTRIQFKMWRHTEAPSYYVGAPDVVLAKNHFKKNQMISNDFVQSQKFMLS